MNGPLTKLIGTWVGTGVAKYPTIETIQYDEELTFSSNYYDDVIQYEQKTWIGGSNDLKKRPIFWECGFIISKENEILLVNTQKSGRIENMIISLKELAGDKLEMIATSTAYLNDPRMISSKRVFIITEEKLDYEMYMITTIIESQKNPEFHLKASLKKTLSR